MTRQLIKHSGLLIIISSIRDNKSLLENNNLTLQIRKKSMRVDNKMTTTIMMRQLRKSEGKMGFKISVLNVLILLIMLNMFQEQAMCLPYRLQICTAKELARCIDEICMRHGKEPRTGLSMSPYGTISVSDGSIPTRVLLNILRDSDRHTRVRLSNNVKVRRSDDEIDSLELGDYIDTCCHQSCVLYPEKVAPYCSQLWANTIGNGWGTHVQTADAKQLDKMWMKNESRRERTWFINSCKLPTVASFHRSCVHVITA